MYIDNASKTRNLLREGEGRRGHARKKGGLVLGHIDKGRQRSSKSRQDIGRQDKRKARQRKRKAKAKAKARTKVKPKANARAEAKEKNNLVVRQTITCCTSTGQIRQDQKPDARRGGGLSLG